MKTATSWKLIAPIWWAFTWRTGLVGLLVSLSLGVASRMILEGFMPPDSAQMIGSSIMTLAYIPVSLWGFRAALMRKRSALALAAIVASKCCNASDQAEAAKV